MKEIFSSAAFGICLTVAMFWVGTVIQKKTGLVFLNGLVIAGVSIIAILLIFDIPYEDYYVGASFINLFVTPATVCMAITIYNNLPMMKKTLIPILAGALVGSLTAVVSGILLCRLLGLDEVMTMTLLPRSVTTPVAVSISEAMGGVPSITVTAVAIAGISGNLLAPTLCRIFRAKGAVEQGLAIGTCSHAMGTARALEMGEDVGAVSSTAIGLCGVITSIIVLFL